MGTGAQFDLSARLPGSPPHPVWAVLLFHLYLQPQGHNGEVNALAAYLEQGMILSAGQARV